MAVRSLARFYYYIVFIAMLVLAAVGIGFVLNTLLSLTPLSRRPAASRSAPMSPARFSSRAWPG